MSRRESGYQQKYSAIITNPPYALAQEFIERGLA
jgi:hypothetical protein